MWVKSKSHSVVSDSLQPYSPRNSPGQNTGVGSHSLLQGIVPTQGSHPHLPNCRRILYQLSHQGSPQMWELDHNEGWLLKNWCFQIVALEKTLESPFNSKEITSVNTKGNHPKFNPKYSLEGFMLRLWYFCHLMWRVYSVKRAWCWERLKAKGKGGGRGWDG